jgi:hypothetical protein
MTPARQPAVRTCIALLGAALVLVLAGPAEGSDGAGGDSAGPVNADARAWQLFAELNRTPVDDANNSLPRTAATVWETWANARSIFRLDGADPGPWPLNVVQGVAALRFDGVPQTAGAPLRHIVNGAMVPVIDPVAASARLVETRMNRASFEYIRARRLYVVDGQIAAARGADPIDFPAASRHVKAMWQPIGREERGSYVSREFVFADGSRRLYGLAALHIASKELPNWFWATFEHADDAPGSGGAVEQANAAWSHYRLRGTMTRFVDARGRALTLANERLESSLKPGTSSCMTCHARASIGTGGGSVRRLSVFDDDGDTTIPGMSRHAADLRRGFIGLPQPSWYADGNGRLAALDFVWTLERAAQPSTQP